MLKTIFYLSFLLLFLTACSSEKKSDSDQKQEEKRVQKYDSKIKKIDKEILLTTAENKKYILEEKNGGFLLKDSKNKLLLLDIFATWCPPCQAEASVLASLQKKYKEKIQIIGITIQENLLNKHLKKFKKDYNANYILTNSPNNKKIINQIAKRLNLGENFGIPLLAIYKDGKLIQYYQGAVEEEFIQSDIEKALKGTE